MSERFERPVDILNQQDAFQSREVGITHPDRPAHVRLKDNGDIEIVAGEGLMIIMHAATRGITFVADEIKFLTKSQSLRWNDLRFNSRATQYAEPTFVKQDNEQGYSLYRDTDYFREPDDA